MSIKVMEWVWNHSRSRDGQRLVLLAIADCANADGTNAWPSNAEICRKSGLSERAVRNALRGLEKLGELVTELQTGPGGCNRYRIVMTPADSAPRQDVPPGSLSPEGGQSATESVSQTAPVTVLEPTTNRQKNSSPSADDSAVIEAVIVQPPTTQTLIGEWIDHCAEKPPGQVIGQLSKTIKRMLDEGIDYERVRLGVAEWHQRGLHPSTLPSIVHELSTPQQRRSGRQSETDSLFARAAQRMGATEPAHLELNP